MPPINFTKQNTGPFPRREVVAVVVLCFLGAVFRCLFLSGTAIEHFDEGVYASNLWFSPEQGAEYPGRYFYAPPLFPFLIEWSMIFLGSGPWAVFLPSLMLGLLTVPLVWWVARRWFGPTAGLVAALLASFSDLHLIYSRAALTDVGLGFCLLLGVYLIWKSYLSRDWKWPVLAGVIIGAGWAIKYNGWLPLAVGLSGLVPWLLIHGRQQNHKSGYFVRWAVIAVIAFLVWSPVLIGLQQWGGYSVVASNHSRYVVGFSGWLDSFWRQVRNHQLLEGSLSILGLGLVCLVFCFLLIRWNGSRAGRPVAEKSESQAERSTWNLILSGVLAALPLLGVWFLGVSPVLGVLGSTGILLQLFCITADSGSEQGRGDTSRDEPYSKTQGRSLAAWLLAAWFCGLLLATPLYYPYPRLTIPWTISAWLGTAALAGWLEQRWAGSLFCLASQKDKVEPPRLRLLPGLSVVVLALILLVCFKPWRVAAWEPRNGLALVSRQVLADLQAEPVPNAADSILYLYAEPGLFFNLKAQGHTLTGPVADFQFLDTLPPGVPVYLIAGPHAATDADFQKQFQQVRDRFELVKSYDYEPSLLVRLNQAQQETGSETEPVLLYRAK